MLVAVQAVQVDVDHRQRRSAAASSTAQRIARPKARRERVCAAAGRMTRVAPSRSLPSGVRRHDAVGERALRQQLVGVVHLHDANALAAERAHGIERADVEHVEGDRVAALRARAAGYPALAADVHVLGGERDLDVAVVLLRRLGIADALHHGQLLRSPRRASAPRATGGSRGCR
jgi:hypothetical protein